MSNTNLTEYIMVKLPNNEHKEKILHFPRNMTSSKLPLCVGVNEQSQNNKEHNTKEQRHTASWQGRRARKYPEAKLKCPGIQRQAPGPNQGSW